MTRRDEYTLTAESCIRDVYTRHPNETRTHVSYTRLLYTSLLNEKHLFRHKSIIISKCSHANTRLLYTSLIHVSYTRLVYTSLIHVSYTRLFYTSLIHVSFTHLLYSSRRVAYSRAVYKRRVYTSPKRDAYTRLLYTSLLIEIHTTRHVTVCFVIREVSQSNETCVRDV